MKNIFVVTVSLLIFGCNNNQQANRSLTKTASADTVITPTQRIDLPEPYATKSVRNSAKVIGWPTGQMPVAPAGFTVEKFADGFDHPRWIYQASNGDIFVAESNGRNSADRITLLRDADGNGVPETRTAFLQDLNQPFGMYIIGSNFYVANTDGVVIFPYKEGAVSITDKGRQIISLPAGARHWTKNIIANADNTKMYVAIGSGSDHAENGIEKENRRACILEMNIDGTGEKMFASGLRNPVGMAWAPGTHTLWTAVNERDELGDDLVPDYMTSVKEGGFYGWPYSYYGDHKDPRIKPEEQKEDLVKRAIVPDVSLNSHTASLGLAFYDKNNFPDKYKGGAFIGQHGSWNRSVLSGYKVVFVPFKNGHPSGKPEDFLTGFIANTENEVYGRPVGVTVLKDGSLLVADDASNIVWRVSAKK